MEETEEKHTNKNKRDQKTNCDLQNFSKDKVRFYCCKLMNLPKEKSRLIKKKTKSSYLQRNCLLGKSLLNSLKNKNESSSKIYKNENVEITKSKGI